MTKALEKDIPSVARGLAHFRGALAHWLDYGRARLSLLDLEFREALRHFAIIAVLAIAALVLLVLGYFLAVVAAAFLLQSLLGHGWPVILLGLAAAHFLIALILVLIAKAKLSRPTFAATLDEITKDRAWLQSPTQPPLP